MSEWFYIRIAFALTWAVLIGYTVLLTRRSRAAERALNEFGGGAE